MMELNSITVVILMEALLALFLLTFALLLFLRKKSIGDQDVSRNVIDNFQNTEDVKVEKLSAIVTAHCNIEPELLNELLDEVKSSERHLYQQIIRMFLTRDGKLLEDIELHINQLSEPYCKFLTHSSDSTVVAGKVNEQEQKNSQLIEENGRLSEQLTIAMSTMDEISAEYSRVFSGTQTELELGNSSKKMFAIFQNAGVQIKTTTEIEGKPI